MRLFDPDSRSALLDAEYAVMWPERLISIQVLAARFSLKYSHSPAFSKVYNKYMYVSSGVMGFILLSLPRYLRFYYYLLSKKIN